MKLLGLGLLVLASLASREVVAFWPRGAAPRASLHTQKDSISCISKKGSPSCASSGDEPAPDVFADQTCMTEDEASEAIERFSRLLQFRTVSSPTAQHHVMEPEQFAQLHEWLPAAYPEVWAGMEVERVGSGGLSLLLKWTGSAEQGARQQGQQGQQGQEPVPPAVLFISHLDVVPVPPETLPDWQHGPFSGDVAGGYVWGRGALDVKVGVSGLLEAATLLLRAGWAPRRTLYFAFGQDEEVGGEKGAATTAALLASRNVTLAMAYDEGGSMGSDGYPPFTTVPFALVGVAEKGYATITVRVNTTGGHSSLPPLDGSSAAAIAARVVGRIDRVPPPTALTPPVAAFLRALAPHTPGLYGTLFRLAGLGIAPLDALLAGVVLARGTPETAALVRNTAAVTGLTSGVAENVLPPAAAVRVNFRLLPGAKVEDLLEYLNRTAGRDLPHVSFELEGSQAPHEATPVTPADSPYLGLIKRALQEVYALRDGSGSVEVAPALMLGGTDSKHYLPLTAGRALRCTPVSGNKAAGDMARVHGLNERLSVGDHGRAVCVYRRLLQLVGEADA